MAKSFPAGIARGAIGLAGLPGDVRDIALSALPKPPAPQPAPSGLYGKVVSALEGARSALELPTSAGIQNKVESATGPLYEPQTTAGKYAQAAGEFLPAAVGGEGSIGSRLLKMVAIPSAASEAAGEATEGTAAEPFARMAGAILGGGVPAALAKSSATRAAIQSTPTAEALYQAGRNQYKQIKKLGVEIDPVPISHLMDSVENDLTQDGLTARNVPETYGVINTLKNPPPGSVLTAQNFDSARQELLQATKNATNRREAAAAWPVINRLDDYLANIPASHVLQGDAQQAAQLFGNARGNWAAAKRADIVGGKLDLAELNACDCELWRQHRQRHQAGGQATPPSR